MTKERYSQICDISIQKNYKKCSNQDPENLIKKEKNIAQSLGLSDRIQIPAKSEAYPTFKDHKPNFRNNPTLDS